MSPLLHTLWRICLLRAGPQQLPASRDLTIAVLVGHWAVGLALSLFGLPLHLAAVSAAVGTLLMVALVHGLLLMRGFGARFYQTLTALAGCELLLGLLALPLTAWFYFGPQPQIASLLSLGLVGWSLAITAHIFHHALQLNRIINFGLALLYLMVSYFLAGLIAPAGA